MRKELLFIMLSLILFSCKKHEEHVIHRPPKLPDNAFTVPVRLINFSKVEKYDTTVHSGFSHEDYKVKIDEYNDIEIYFTKMVESYNNLIRKYFAYKIVIRKFSDEYRCYYCYGPLPTDNYRYNKTLIFFSNLDSAATAKLFPRVVNRTKYKIHSEVIIDFSKKYDNFEFFNNIKFLD